METAALLVEVAKLPFTPLVELEVETAALEEEAVALVAEAGSLSWRKGVAGGGGTDLSTQSPPSGIFEATSGGEQAVMEGQQ